MTGRTLKVFALVLLASSSPLVAQDTPEPASRVVEIRSYNLKPGLA